MRCLKLHHENSPATIAGLFSPEYVNGGTIRPAAVVAQRLMRPRGFRVSAEQAEQFLPHVRPLAPLRQFVHTILAVLLLLPLTVKGYDPDAGMVAARLLGQKQYLAFKINGHLDSAAVFSFEGHRYIYHPAFGSARMPDGVSVLDYFPGCMWVPVLCVPRTANLANACLPLAITQAWKRGGTVCFVSRVDPNTGRSYNHAFASR